MRMGDVHIDFNGLMRIIMVPIMSMDIAGRSKSTGSFLRTGDP